MNTTQKVFVLILFLIAAAPSLIFSAEQELPSEQPTITNNASSRSDEWQDLRDEKTQNLEPNKTSKTEKLLIRFEERRILFSYKGFYPTIANVSTGSGFAPGVHYWGQNLFGTNIDLQGFAAYSTREYQLYKIEFGKILRRGTEPLVNLGGSGGLSQFGRLQGKGNDFLLYTDLQYRDFPQEDFFGVGPDSEDDYRTDYTITESAFDVVAGYRIGEHTLIAGRAGLLNPEIEDGTDSRFQDISTSFNDTSAPGLAEQPDYLRFGANFVLDYRDRPGNPNKGGLLGVEYARFEDRDLDAYSFHRFSFDGRGYLPLGSPQRTLAARVYTTLDDPDEGQRVPFYYMETMGGSEFLRGFREFRFRDRNLLAMSAEYRWEGAPAWEMAFFFDAGKVFSDRSDFNFEDLETSYGFGVRFKLPDAMFLRFDIGRSDEGTRFWLKWGVASF